MYKALSMQLASSSSSPSHLRLIKWLDSRKPFTYNSYNRTASSVHKTGYKSDAFYTSRHVSNMHVNSYSVIQHIKEEENFHANKDNDYNIYDVRSNEQSILVHQGWWTMITKHKHCTLYICRLRDTAVYSSVN